MEPPVERPAPVSAGTELLVALSEFIPKGMKEAKYFSITNKTVNLVSTANVASDDLEMIVRAYKEKLVLAVAQRGKKWRIFTRPFPVSHFAQGVIQICNALLSRQNPDDRQQAVDSLDDALFNNNRRLKERVRRAVGIQA